jgi:hypothetical protein
MPDRLSDTGILHAGTALRPVLRRYDPQRRGLGCTDLRGARGAVDDPRHDQRSRQGRDDDRRDVSGRRCFVTASAPFGSVRLPTRGGSYDETARSCCRNTSARSGLLRKPQQHTPGVREREPDSALVVLMVQHKVKPVFAGRPREGGSARRLTDLAVTAMMMTSQMLPAIPARAHTTERSSRPLGERSAPIEGRPSVGEHSANCHRRSDLCRLSVWRRSECPHASI